MFFFLPFSCFVKDPHCCVDMRREQPGDLWSRIIPLNTFCSRQKKPARGIIERKEDTIGGKYQLSGVCVCVCACVRVCEPFNLSSSQNCRKLWAFSRLLLDEVNPKVSTLVYNYPLCFHPSLLCFSPPNTPTSFASPSTRCLISDVPSLLTVCPPPSFALSLSQCIKGLRRSQ